MACDGSRRPTADSRTLQSLALFRSVDESTLASIAGHIGPTCRLITSGARIVERGTPMDALLLLLAGNAHAEIITGDGHAMIVESFRAPDVIATAMLFAPRPQFPVSLSADSDCTVAWLARNYLLELCQQHRGVLEALLADTGRRTAFLAARLRLTQFASLRQRIAVFIAEEKTRHAADGAEYVHLTHTRQELAEMFGVARPSLSRELGRMAEDGLIELDGARIRVLDRGALETLVSGCE